MTLVDKQGRQVKQGAILRSFRGEVATLISMTPPRHSGSTGRVYVAYASPSFERGEVFPSVFGLTWEAR